MTAAAHALTAALAAGVSFAAPAASGAGAPPNGFYVTAAGPLGRPITTQDGRAARLGKPHALKILGTDMQSSDNENTRFQLTVTVPYDARLRPDAYVLVVDGHAHRQSGSGASQNESFLTFSISGSDQARRVAGHLGATIRYRRHPGHHLLVRFVPERPRFDRGAGVFATLRITNVGRDSVAFMQGGRNRSARDNQYVFTARHRGEQVEDVGTSYHSGGLAHRRVLAPGDTFEDRVDLGKWFAFARPGLYEIHGAYYLDLVDPAGDAWRTSWEDYASADFVVQIDGS